MPVNPEIIKGAKILLVGRDPGDQEVRLGRPFVGPAGQLLDRCLGLAGLQRGKDVSITNVVNSQPAANVFARHSRAAVHAGIDELLSLIERARPEVVVCLGNEAAAALIPDWPSKDGSLYGAYGIQERRGYWEHVDVRGHMVAVLPTLHPSGILRSGGRGTGAIDEMLLTYDLERAKEQIGKPFKRPDRDVTVVTTEAQAEVASREILKAGWAACDIEIYSDMRLACIGFAPSSKKAYVFTPATFGAAFDLLHNPKLATCFHNGQFDLFFLRTRCGVNVANYADDTIIAFHICWPALAGKGERGSKRTQKSLKFLSSLYTKDAWWKDYDFENDYQMYLLNGIDCMVTFDVHHRLVRERRLLQISDSIYRHEISLVWPCIKILERGIRVDVKRLTTNRSKLASHVDKLSLELEAVVKPLLEEARGRVSNPKLFWKTTACKCCGNGKLKRAECWECAGFTKKPGKRDLAASGKTLGPCQKCDGRGSDETFSFNFDSTDQKKILLYEVLGIQPRYQDGKPSVSEDKLKAILGTL